MPAVGARRRPRRLGDARRPSTLLARGHDGRAVIVSSFDSAPSISPREYAPAASRPGGSRTAGGRARRRASRPSTVTRGSTPTCAPRSRPAADGIDAAHAAGLLVSVWTVDDPDDARALAAAGVDIIITNVPDVVIGALGDG